jgi:hypothetical protein
VLDFAFGTDLLNETGRGLHRRACAAYAGTDFIIAGRWFAAMPGVRFQLSPPPALRTRNFPCKPSGVEFFCLPRIWRRRARPTARCRWATGRARVENDLGPDLRIGCGRVLWRDRRF